MRFLFVDRIAEIKGKHILGERLFSLSEPLRFTEENGQTRLCQGVVAEAIGQLASWLALRDNDFTGRPVFLFADRIAVHGPVQPGQRVQLEAHIDHLDEDSFRFSGRAFVDGQMIQEIQECSGAFMELSKMEDPEVCRRRFHDLTNGGLVLEGVEGKPYPLQELVGEQEGTSEDATFQIKIPEEAPFFADHFPRHPVTPIVVLNELIGVAASRMLNGERGMRLVPQAISAIKIRSFVKPGETIAVRLRRDQSVAGAEHYVLRAELLRGGRPILRGRYAYEKTVGGIH